MKTRRGRHFAKRTKNALDIFGRVAAVILCLPLFVVMFAEMRKRLL